MLFHQATDVLYYTFLAGEPAQTRRVFLSFRLRFLTHAADMVTRSHTR